jgi:ABC-type uncharacterized transport system YnjBCD substrate-binding protein
MAQKGNSNLKVIALVVVCVVLIASTVGALALYIPSQTQITDKDQTITSLNQQIAALQQQINAVPNTSTYTAQIAALQAQIAQYNASLASLSTEYQNLQKIADLATYGNLYSNNFSQDLNTTTTLWSGTIDYAGYAIIEGTSNVTSTYVQVTNIFSSTYTLASNQTLGTSGILIFPVLPGTLEVKVGNVNEAAQVNATAVYYY